jgi:uncharacterized BrkB/YihY/UPF0761 family membrane protein
MRDGSVSKQSAAGGRAAVGAMDGYTRDAPSQFAAAIAYRMLFSLVPLVSFVTAIADALLPDKQQNAVAGWLASVVPGQALDKSVHDAITGLASRRRSRGSSRLPSCCGPRAG